MVELEDALKKLHDEHDVLSLRTQIADILSLGVVNDAQAFWIRDTDDLINVVVLGSQIIWDVSLQSSSGMCGTILLRHKDVISIETREAQDAAVNIGMGVKGNVVVVLHTAAERGGVMWAGGEGVNSDELRIFTAVVVKAVFAL